MTDTESTECPVITDEIKKQLIGLLPFDADATEEYTPTPFEKVPEKFRPVFTIRPLKQVERERMSLYINKLAVMESMETKQKESMELNDKMNDIIRQCVVSFGNYYDIGTKKLIKYQEDATGGLSKQLWHGVTEAVKTNLYYRVNGISGLLYNEAVTLRS